MYFDISSFKFTEQLKPITSQYVLQDLNKNSSKQKAQVVQKVDSEYVLRDLRNQADQNQNFSRDAPNRPFLTGTPVNAKEIRYEKCFNKREYLSLALKSNHWTMQSSFHKLSMERCSSQLMETQMLVLLLKEAFRIRI